VSALASTEDLAILLQLSASEAATQEDNLQFLLDQAETTFLRETNRIDIPFRGAQTGRVEEHEGTATRRLWLDYPVAALTAIVLGPDLSHPTEIFDTTDPSVVHFHVRRRELIRMDGGTWLSPKRGNWRTLQMDVSFVRVTYNAQADLPADVTAAILAMAAEFYRGLGSTGAVQSERLDNYSVTFATRAATIAAPKAWTDAVTFHRRLASI